MVPFQYCHDLGKDAWPLVSEEQNKQQDGCEVLSLRRELDRDAVPHRGIHAVDRPPQLHGS